MNSELEKRVTALEDIEAIKQLKAEYCSICDDGHDPERIKTIFATDGVWEGSGFGQHRGHDAIAELFRRLGKRFSFSQHCVMNPIISIQGERATGFWNFFGPFTLRKRNSAAWLAVRYQDDYVKLAGVWKIQHLRGVSRMFASYETGWAHNPTERPLQ
jgi:hypothetical protein